MQAARRAAILRNLGRRTLSLQSSQRSISSLVITRNKNNGAYSLLDKQRTQVSWTEYASRRSMSLEAVTIDEIYADEKRNPEELFLREDVQRLLKSMTGYDLTKIFRRQYGKEAEAPKYQFMTDEELLMAREVARERAKERLEMPPILRPSKDEPKVHAYDPEMQGFIDSNLIFVDVSQGYSNKNRLMVVREPNGILRDANRQERYRANTALYPQRDRFQPPPPIFEEENFQRVLDGGDHLYMLDRLCLQFEPDDPQYIELTCRVYEHLRKTGDFDKLQSTRHFGPMAFYFAYHSRIDELLMFLIDTRNIAHARELVELYSILAEKGPLPRVENDLDLVKFYIENHATQRFNLEKSLISYLRAIEEEEESQKHGSTQEAANN